MSIDASPNTGDAERKQEGHNQLVEDLREMRKIYGPEGSDGISSRFSLLNGMAKQDLLFTYNKFDQELKELQKKYPDPDELEKRDEYIDLMFRSQVMPNITSQWLDGVTAQTGVINADTLPAVLKQARHMREMMTKKEQRELIEVAAYILDAPLPEGFQQNITKPEEAYKIMIDHLNSKPESREYVGMLLSFITQDAQTKFAEQYAKNVDDPKKALLALNETGGLSVISIEAALGSKLSDEEAILCGQRYIAFKDLSEMGREIARTPFGSTITGDQLTGTRILGTVLTMAGYATVALNVGVNIKTLAKSPVKMVNTGIPAGGAMIIGGKSLLSKKTLTERLAGKDRRGAQKDLQAQNLLLRTLNSSPRGWDPFLSDQQNRTAIEAYLDYLNGEVGTVSEETISLAGFQKFLAEPANADRFAAVSSEIKRLNTADGGERIGVTERSFKELVWSFDVLGINEANYTEKVGAAMEVV